MKKNFRAIKASLITGILLISLFVAIVPLTSARQGIFINFSSVVILNWENKTEEPIVPIQDLISYKLILEYRVTRGGLFGENLIYVLFQNRRVNIKLEVVDTPEWVTAQLETTTIPANIPKIVGTPDRYYANIILSLKEDAPAFERGTIGIKIAIPNVGPIQGFDQTLYLNFKPAYRALIDVNPQINSKIIGPMDTTSFPIDINNQGNGRTKVFLEIDYESLPEGWSAVIDDNVIIEAGSSSEKTKTVYLTVYPPKSFGYHDDIANIRVKVTPTWAEDTSIEGKYEYVTLNVESRGISVIGIEMVFTVVVLIALILVGVYIVFKRYKK
jgi:hypothetical protein